MIVVVDASAVGAFLLPDEAGHFADFARQAFMTREVFVPPHWSVELANILWKAQRRKRIAPIDQAAIARTATAIAAIVTVGAEPPIEELSALATDLGLTAYDTAYFWQARTLTAPLLTTDGALRRVAAECGIEILLP